MRKKQKRVRYILLCGEKWKIEIVKELEHYAGRTFHAENTIKILEKKTSTADSDTLTHELFHAVIHSHACDYNCANGNGVPDYLVIMNHAQLNNVVREVWGGLRQIYEMRTKP